MSTESIPFAHVPRCRCELEAAPYHNARDPKCQEWDAIVRHWLATHDATVRADERRVVVGEAVEAIRAARDECSAAWGGPAAWMTTGAHVADVASGYFAEVVAGLDGGEGRGE